jgi:glycopeptide antibiotics resistance protein
MKVPVPLKHIRHGYVREKATDTKNTKLTLVLFAVYVLLLTGIILFKLPFFSESLSDGIRVINLIPLGGSFDENGNLILWEMVNNILLFIPLGVYLCMLKGKMSFACKVLTIIGLTLSFEAIQFIFALGRSDITDILDNTLGGIIGIGVYAVLSKVLKDRTVKIVSILALAVTFYVVLRFGYLFYLSNIVMRQLHP